MLVIQKAALLLAGVVGLQPAVSGDAPPSVRTCGARCRLD